MSCNNNITEKDSYCKWSNRGQMRKTMKKKVWWRVEKKMK